jgi:hypothetical protein
MAGEINTGGGGSPKGGTGDPSNLLNVDIAERRENKEGSRLTGQSTAAPPLDPQVMGAFLEFRKSKPVSLKAHGIYNEKWLQGVVVEDPSLLGLGDLIVKDVERRQPRAGRLDLLLSDPETNTRYEVEIQLGATDEAHIIRTVAGGVLRLEHLVRGPPFLTVRGRGQRFPWRRRDDRRSVGCDPLLAR